MMHKYRLTLLRFFRILEWLYHLNVPWWPKAQVKAIFRYMCSFYSRTCAHTTIIGVFTQYDCIVLLSSRWIQPYHFANVALPSGALLLLSLSHGA